MSVGSHSRAGHRAVAAGGPMLLARLRTSTGHHRRTAVARRRAPREPERPMQLAMSGLGVLIMAALCGLSLFFIVADERRGHDDSAAAVQPMTGHDLGSRATDPVPLSLDEVFPDPRIELITGTTPYQVLMTHIDSDCTSAAMGTLGRLLVDHGCSQVVRAALTAPYGGYQVTAGVFNLADASQALLVGNAIGGRLDAGDGGFGVLATGLLSTDPAHPPPSQADWHERGHYLVYCVISRPDGQPVLDDDPYAERITDDLVESYLGGTVLGRRTSDP
jgi:hypothetical protein